MSATAVNFQDLTQNISAGINTLRADLPDVLKGFNDLGRAATKDGALSKKTKELIALALGVAAHCDGCIGFHTQTLIKLGATRQEIEEALSIAVYMGGGPSLMYSANAIAAFEQFSARVTA